MTNELEGLIAGERDFLRALLENVEDGIVACDADGVLRYFNRATRQMHGLPEEPVPAERWAEFYGLFHADGETPLSRDEVPLFRALRDGVVRDAEVVIRSADGSLRRVVTSGRALFDASGKKVGAAVSMHEITDRHVAAEERAARTRAEALASELRESQMRYRLVSQAANDAIWDWNLVTNQVVWNEGVTKMFQYELGQVGTDASWWIEHIHPDDRDRVADGIHAAIDGGKEMWHDEYRFRRADGDHTQVYDRGSIVHGEDGKAVRMVGSMLDLTERLRTEAQLAESEERVRLAVESADVGTFDYHPGSGALTWSDRCKAIFGLPLETTVDYDIFLACLHPDDHERTSAAVSQSLAPDGTGAYEIEYRVLWLDGTVRWIVAKGQTLFAGAGAEREPSRLLGTVRDITETKQAEEALRASEAQQRRLTAEARLEARRKDEFLAMLAHELRNPLAAVQNALEVGRRRAKGVTDLAAPLEVIARQTASLRHIVDDLLDVSRITRGVVELRREPVELRGVIRRALEGVGGLVEQRKHEVHVSLTDEPLHVVGDVVRLEQVLVNLLSNAAKYTLPGGRIDVSLRASPERAEIRVKDSGIGMTPETRSRVFELFEQAERDLDRSQGGLGIGLTIVKQLVELHDGHIEARSDGLGQGSELILHLPLTDNASAAASAAVESPAPRSEGTRVLIVDDNRDAADTLGELVEILGYQVRVAYDGHAALEAFARWQPDTVLLDIGLPGLDGYEVARRLRAIAEPGLRLVAITGYGQPRDRALALEAGFDRHEVKPMSFATLTEILPGSA